MNIYEIIRGRGDTYPAKTAWTRFLLILTVGLSILRVGLFCRTPSILYANWLHDDANQIFVARQLYLGRWLGEYTNTTLIKGISFPAFVAFARKIGVPYMFLTGIFYILACFLVVFALRRTIKNGTLCAVLYLFLLYSPTGFDARVTQRVYRNALVYPAVLLVTACVLGVFFSARERLPEYAAWIVCAAFSFSFFYYLREDSVWIVPLFAGGLLFTLIHMLLGRMPLKRLILRAVLLVLPVLTFLGVTKLYRQKNLKEYGIDVITDRTDGSFGKLMGDILKVEEGRLYQKEDMGIDNELDPSDFWVSKATLQKVIDACPSLKKGEGNYIGTYEMWAGSTGFENLPGDMYVWAFRTALMLEGHFESGKSLESFCAKADEELRDAFAKGILTCSDEIYLSSQSKGITLRKLPHFIRRTAEHFNGLCRLAGVYASDGISEGSAAEIRAMEAMTGTHGVYPDAVFGPGRDTTPAEIMDEVYLNGIDDMLDLNKRVIQNANGVIQVYRVITPILVICGLDFWIFLLIMAFLNRRWESWYRWLIHTALFGSAAALVFGVTVFSEWRGDGDLFYYCSGAMGLLFLFGALGLIWGITQIRSLVEKHRGGKHEAVQIR